jgi:hypothetical protein
MTVLVEVIHPIPRDPIACPCGADLELLEHPARIGCPKGCNPEHISTIVDRVMLSILERAGAGAQTPEAVG